MPKNPVSDIKKMHIQSASTIAIISLKYLLFTAKRYGFGKKFISACNELSAARPTAVVLHNCIEKIKKEKNIQAIENLANDLKNSYSLISRNAMRLFTKKKIVVLTHCHSTIVIGVLKQLKKQRSIEVYVTETRPKDQGILTAKELLKSRIKINYIIDSAIGDYIKNIDFILVGADALRRQGLVNKVGTYPLAVVAKENKKPFYVATSTFTVDKRKNIIIEERPHKEITHKHLKGAKIHNPAFDITSYKYISKIITEQGIFTPAQLKKKFFLTK